MELFTPEEYLKIDIANNVGWDKLSYAERIRKVDTELDPNNLPKNESPNQARIGYQELLKVQRGELSNYCISLDATASIGQLISVLTNCRKTAQQSKY